MNTIWHKINKCGCDSIEDLTISPPLISNKVILNMLVVSGKGPLNIYKMKVKNQLISEMFSFLRRLKN